MKDFFLKLRSEYTRTFSKKMEDMAISVARALHSRKREEFIALQKAVRILAGTSYAYSYYNVSESCTQIDFAIQNALHENEWQEAKWAPLLNFFLKNLDLELHYSEREKGMDQQGTVQTSYDSRAPILIIDGESIEPEWAWGKGCGLHIQHLSYEAMKQTENLSDAVLLLFVQSESTDSFLAKLHAIADKIFDLKWGVIGFQGNATERLKVVDLGAHLFFTKQMESKHFALALEQEMHKNSYTEKEAQARVFGIGLEEKILSCLREMYADVTHFSNPDLFFEEISKKVPEVIMLQKQVEQLSLSQLIQLIQADVRTQHLPILIIGQPETTLDVHNVEWLVEPISSAILKQKLKEIIYRQRSLMQMTNRDHLTGVYTAERFFEAARSERPCPNSLLLLFHLENLDQIIESYGFNASDAVLFQVGHYLMRFFYPLKDMYRIKENQFLVLFKEMPRITVERMACHFIHNLQHSIYIPENSDLQLECVYSLCDYPEHGTSWEKLYAYGQENVMELIFKRQRLSKSAKIFHILVIDQDQELAELLTDYLAANDLITKTASNGAEALKILDENKQQKDSPLIILERNLSDMDGLDFLEHMKRYYKKFRFCFLSNKNTDEEAISCIQLGSLDYVEKPFNVELLTEKIIKWMCL